MADLTKEYTDIRNRKHKVEHLTVLTEEENGRERVLDELFHVLSKTGRRKPA